MKAQTTILAIETSCDETGVAVVRKEGQKMEVLADKVASQIDVHKETGGIVPEIAAREHVTVIQPLVKQVLEESGVGSGDIDAIAVTVGPGLMPALSVGVTAAQTLSFAWNKPIVPVHHLEGHIYSALLSVENKAVISNCFPVLALIVSGGHTMLVEMRDHLQYQILGSTRDDAAGEAFDKVARLLGMEYPGGPLISEAGKQGDKNAWKFSRPMLHSGDLDFSFSGLKTELFYTVRDLGTEALSTDTVNNLAASFQRAVVDTLIAKTEKATKQIQPKLLLLTGGVAANDMLRSEWKILAERHGLPFGIAPLELCGDNATMIGQAGVFAFEAGRISKWSDIDAQARVSLEQYSVDQPVV